MTLSWNNTMNENYNEKTNQWGTHSLWSGGANKRKKLLLQDV